MFINRQNLAYGCQQGSHIKKPAWQTSYPHRNKPEPVPTLAREPDPRSSQEGGFVKKQTYYPQMTLFLEPNSHHHKVRMTSNIGCNIGFVPAVGSIWAGMMITDLRREDAQFSGRAILPEFPASLTTETSSRNRGIDPRTIISGDLRRYY